MHPTILLAVIMCSTAVMITAMSLVSRHIAQRRLSSAAPSGAEIARRLERIEQVVEATAIEVERVGESNRFLTKLLAAKTGTLPP